MEEAQNLGYDMSELLIEEKPSAVLKMMYFRKKMKTKNKED